VDSGWLPLTIASVESKWAAGTRTVPLFVATSKAGICTLCFCSSRAA